MTATNLAEYVILVDEENRPQGKAEKFKAHAENLLHRAFSVFIFREVNQQLELLIQQRAFDKYHSPGLWTNTCCSHPRDGETIIEAGERRLKDELGLEAKLRDLGWFHYNAHFKNGLSENEIDHVLVGFVNADIVIKPNFTEVAAFRWIELSQLKQALAENSLAFTPWFAPALAIAVESTI